LLFNTSGNIFQERDFKAVIQTLTAG